VGNCETLQRSEILLYAAPENVALRGSLNARHDTVMQLRKEINCRDRWGIKGRGKGSFSHERNGAVVSVEVHENNIREGLY
jgi:hypothetical protein